MHSPLLIFVQIDVSGGIQLANIVFGRVVGIKPSDLIGLNIADVLQIDNMNNTIIGRAIKESRSISGNGSLSGLLRTSCLQAAPVIKEGEVVAVKLFGIPRTGKAGKHPPRLPMEIAPSFDHLKRFASIAAHEVGNALSTIFATAQLLQSIAPNEQSVNRLAERIETATNHAMLIIDDLKVLGTPIRQIKLVDVNETLREVTETMNAEALAAGVLFDLQLDDTLPEITSDHGRLRQVFTNLIKNGLDAMNEKNKGVLDEQETYGDPQKPLSKLIIRSRIRKDGTIGISFFNHGPPILPELRERLFEPFFSTKSGGVGLGLSICREIVEGHGGTLVFRSSARFGTFFRINLPMVPQPNETEVNN